MPGKTEKENSGYATPDEYDQFLRALREQILALAILGMPVQHLWAFPARQVGGKAYRQVHAFTEAGEIIFELRV